MAKALFEYDKVDYIASLTAHNEQLIETGQDPLELEITTMIANGLTLRQIAGYLKFPVIHLANWIRTEHPGLLETAEVVNQDSQIKKVLEETEDYDGENHKYLKDKHSIVLSALKQRRESTPKKEANDTGTNFNIQVVMPDYIDKPEIKIIEAEVKNDK